MIGFNHEENGELKSQFSSKKYRGKKPFNKRRGIYLIPNLCTMGNLFCGFYAIVSVLNGDYITACQLILAAVVFDGLDGRLARLTNSGSRFGVEFDSLADLVSFGVAPGILIYCWALQPYGRIGWLASFLFVACGAMRLARFNVIVDSPEKNYYFVGLPIPAAASLIASFVILHNYLFTPSGNKSSVIAFIAYALAFLMVSNIKYPSFKNLNLKQKKPFSILVTVLLVSLIIIAEPQITLFILFASYPLFGVLKSFSFCRDLTLYKRLQEKFNLP